jgi:serine/threonine-protein kinase
LSVSADGTLAYVPGGASVNVRTLVWVDRQGREEPLPTQPRPYSWVRVSPDGTRVAMEVQDGENTDVWIHDIARRTQTRLTFGPEPDRFPFWTPDGRRIVWSSGSDLVWKPADGTGQVERLATSNTPLFPSAWSRDGSTLLAGGTAPSVDILALPMEGRRELQTLIATEFNEGRPAISPNGKWMAYFSNESRRFEIYVRPFPNVDDGRWQISTGGGTSPVWSPDGRHLFFRNGDAMMTVPVNTDGVFTAGTPELLFRGTYVSDEGGAGRVHDISPDGKRFLMIKEGGERTETRPHIIVVLNWFEELRQRVPN